MAKKWYPVIDYLECVEFGTCVEKCTHGVYDKTKAPSPLVVKPEACIDHCHGCGNICPQGAITYVGDNTGWKPPLGKPEGNVSCCDSGCGSDSSCDCGSDSTCGCGSDSSCDCGSDSSCDCGSDSSCGCGNDSPCDCEGSCDCGPDTICDCGSDCEEDSVLDKTLTIDFLYLDLKTCERCMGTEQVLVNAINEVKLLLKTLGYSVIMNKIEISNEILAEQYKFVSSPTIRVNGQDICHDVKENSCGSCSDISSQSVNCRIFNYSGKEYNVPPKAMIVNGILSAVYGSEYAMSASEPYSVPENLKKFFNGKHSKSNGCCCGDDCC